MSNTIKFIVDGVVMVTANDHDAEVGQLKADNERLRRHKNDYMEAAEETRKALLTQLAEARELLTGSRNKINYMLQNGEWYEPGRMIERIDAWLEANKHMALQLEKDK